MIGTEVPDANTMDAQKDTAITLTRAEDALTTRGCTTCTAVIHKEGALMIDTTATRMLAIPKVLT